MARRSMNAKIQPAVMKMNFVATTSGTGPNYFHIDISQAASILNRRFYRQGLNWAVAGIKILTEQGASGSVSVNKLPNTWVMSNAWEKGFRAWQRQQKETLEDGTEESVKAKYNDFKIFANPAHLIAGVNRNLLPISARDPAGGPYTANDGEWEMSQVVVPNYGTPGNNWEPYITAVGDYITSGPDQCISLIKAYESSRSTPQSPDPATPASVTNTNNVWRALFDVGDNNEDVLQNVVGKNDELPYPQVEYPGGSTQLPSLEIHDTEYVTTTTIGGTTELDGGNFPCGLMEVGTFGFADESDIAIELTLVPGKHRGYLAESMTEM